MPDPTLSDPDVALEESERAPTVGKAHEDVTAEEPLTETAASPNQLTWARGVFWFLILCFVALQHRLWVGEGSFAEVWRLKLEIEKQDQENHILGERNRRLAAEVKDLRDGTAAVEERARKHLGMIKDDETLYIIHEKSR